MPTITVSTFDVDGKLLGWVVTDALTCRVFSATGTLEEERPATPEEARAATENDRQVNGTTLRAWLQSAYQANRTFFGLGAATTTLQTGAQVRALTQQNQRLIRLIADMLDGAD